MTLRKNPLTCWPNSCKLRLSTVRALSLSHCFGLCLVLSLLAGCVTTPNIRTLRQIKSVAIIAFALTPQDAEVELPDRDHLARDAAQLYELVALRLREKHHWQSLAAEAVARSTVYQHLFEHLSVHMLAGGMQVHGLLSPIDAINLKPKDRTQLMQSLRVDALISISFILRNADRLSNGKSPPFPYAARVSFDVYAMDKHQDKANAVTIWTVSSLPTAKHGPLPKDFRLQSRDQGVAAVAMTVNDALTVLLAQKF